MIEADSSLANDGNEYFSPIALDEFLHFRDLKDRPDLQSIRKHILENIYIDVDGNHRKKINVNFLMEYANELRNK